MSGGCCGLAGCIGVVCVTVLPGMRCVFVMSVVVAVCGGGVCCDVCGVCGCFVCDDCWDAHSKDESEEERTRCSGHS